MTVFLPSTTVSVLRGTSIDPYGDEVDIDAAVATALPAAITEGKQRTWNPAEQRGGVIEQYTIRFRPGVDVAEQDRLRDDNTGVIYQVREVNRPPRIVSAPDVRVTAVRVAKQ